MLHCSFHSELSSVNICFLIDKLKFQILISALHLFNAKSFYKSKKWYLDKKTLWPFLFLVSFIIFNILFVTISIIFFGVSFLFFLFRPPPPRGGDVGWVGGALYFNKSVSNSCSILNASNIHLAIRG